MTQERSPIDVEKLRALLELQAEQERKQGFVRVQGLPFVAGFSWSVGFQMERFIKSLKDKKLLASKCPQCGYTYVPPRNYCAKCYAQIDEKDNLELSGEGTLESWTVAYVELDGKGNWVDLKEPKIIGAIKLDGANSLIFMPIEAKPEELEKGMKVAIEWNKELKGAISDIKCFKPKK